MNIFVANLDFRIQSEDLKQIFESFGEISSAKVIMDHETGRSKGFGFVEMANEEEANAAIAKLDGAEIEGKTIAVKIAKPRENNGGGNRGGFQQNRSGNRNFERSYRSEY